MKLRSVHRCSKLLYSLRNKDETIISVIKRLFVEHTSEDTEQRIIIQMHSVQYPKTDQYCYNTRGFDRGRSFAKIVKNNEIPLTTSLL